MLAVTLDEWKKKLESPNREIIILHNPKVKQIKLFFHVGLKINCITKENLISFFFKGILLRITFGNFYIAFTVMKLKLVATATIFYLIQFIQKNFLSENYATIN